MFKKIKDYFFKEAEVPQHIPHETVAKTFINVSRTEEAATVIREAISTIPQIDTGDEVTVNLQISLTFETIRE